MAQWTLLVFLALTIIKVASAGRFLIINEALQGALQGIPQYSAVVDKGKLSGPYTSWYIQSQVNGKGVSISLSPDDDFLSVDDRTGQIYLGKEKQTWVYEFTGKGNMKIKPFDDQELVLGCDGFYGGSVFLVLPGNFPEQLWRVKRIEEDSRLQRQ
ncbi:hypothetical protein EC968_009000 [Mortierella alpina]|nr:hypothetical protein EC968_009000 [Mortierella alpina]